MTTPLSGEMSWDQALAGPLSGTTCLWQDLDGLHVEPPPPFPPYASALWGWQDVGRLVRVRLDGDKAFVAIHDAGIDRPVTEDRGGGHAGPGASPTLPWSLGDGRIAASRLRGPDSEEGGVGAAYEQVIVDGIADGVGPITFLRPVRRQRSS
jgi:hypothetical protein